MSRSTAPLHAAPNVVVAARSAQRAPSAPAVAGVPLYLRGASTEADAEDAVQDERGASEVDDEGGTDAGVAPADAGAIAGAPTQASAPQPNDATATVPTRIRAASTRAGMPDRIPPRVDTPARVTVAGWHIPMVDVILSVDGGGGGNGSATVNGGASAGLQQSATVQLRGVDQTDPGKAGNLHLVARFAGNEVARSGGFSVSSVPQNWSTSLVSTINEPDAVGMVALNSWESDSGTLADLDQVRRMEQIEVVTATGPFAGVSTNTSSWRDATLGSIRDSHRSSGRARLRSVGSRTANQVFVFKCERTAVTDIAAKNSGLQITKAVTDDGAGGFNYDVSKVGAATTANGFSSGAASGSATAPTQTV
jgi:hypothetical protein